METTKEKMKEAAARHKVETAEKKVEVIKAEIQEKVDDVKIGAADLAEKAEEKWEEAKDTAKAVGDKIADKAHDVKEKIKEKLN